MLSSTLVSAMMTASITGAGLVIAFYALIARMSDSIFSCRFEILDEKKQEIERIRSNPSSFKEDNLEKTSSRLKGLSKEIDSVKTFPKYLALGVGVNFGLFIFTSLFCMNWFMGDYAQINQSGDWAIALLFIVSVILFLVVGFYGIFDVRDTMMIQFKNLAKKKTEIKEEIKYAPKEAATLSDVKCSLIALNIDFDSHAIIKVSGKMLRPDIIIPSERNPEYLIEVMSRPTADMIYQLSSGYQPLKEQTGAKTILIADFKGRASQIDVAKAYWDFIIDSGDKVDMFDKLKKILAK